MQAMAGLRTQHHVKHAAPPRIPRVTFPLTKGSANTVYVWGVDEAAVRMDLRWLLQYFMQLAKTHAQPAPNQTALVLPNNSIRHKYTVDTNTGMSRELAKAHKTPDSTLGRLSRSRHVRNDPSSGSRVRPKDRPGFSTRFPDACGAAGATESVAFPNVCRTPSLLLVSETCRCAAVVSYRTLSVAGLGPAPQETYPLATAK